jgi:predicted alpha/beta-hydrolase family hydrolase
MSEKPELLIEGPRNSIATLILAHGAGAPMDSEFMAAFAEGLSGQGLRVVRFEFPYMAERRSSGRQRPPDREPVLRETWHAVIESISAKNLFIGGKSMGGRIASLIADVRGTGSTRTSSRRCASATMTPARWPRSPALW